MKKILIYIACTILALSTVSCAKVGFSGPEAVTAKMDWNFGYSHAKNTGEMSTYENTRSFDGEGKNERKFSNKTGYESKSATDGGGNTPVDSQTLESTLSRTLTGKTEHKGNTKKEGDWKHSWQGMANAKVDGVFYHSLSVFRAQCPQMKLIRGFSVGHAAYAYAGNLDPRIAEHSVIHIAKILKIP